MKRTTIVLLPLVVTMSGCFWVTTKHEGETLRKDVKRIDSTLSKQEETVQFKVKELQEVLDKATTLLTRNSADLGAEVDSLERDNAEMRGLVMEAKRAADAVVLAVKEQSERLDALEKRLASIEEQAAVGARKSPEQMFAEAKVLFDAGDFAKSREAFKSIVISHSTSAVAAEAQYYRGETHFREKDFKSAIGEFQKVFDKYPKSRRADEALYRAGESATELQWCTDARAYFGVLVKRYPKSSLVPRAKKKDSDLRKIAKNRKKCKS